MQLGQVGYLEKSMQQKGKPVCQHLLSNRFCPERTHKMVSVPQSASLFAL